MKHLDHPPLYYLTEMLRLYVSHESGVTDREVAALLNCSVSTVFRNRMLIQPELVSPARYTLAPDATLRDLADAIRRRANGRI